MSEKFPERSKTLLFDASPCKIRRRDTACRVSTELTPLDTCIQQTLVIDSLDNIEREKMPDSDFSGTLLEKVQEIIGPGQFLPELSQCQFCRVNANSF